jgi:[CysO sulfur-carrier protein]-S-L-cysteine hydrolase
MMIKLNQSQFKKIVGHAQEASPSECCGLISGVGETAQTIYELNNVALNSTVSYEAAPEELFAAQRQMRERGEELLGIYHSHPRAAEPTPSETDVRLAYYPRAVYFIVGLGADEPVIRAFRIVERDERWEQVEYAITDE